ncbi:MAG: preprotein translocase subunit SecA [Verrucomicrobiae bacterium]|nr:preprotein translocase subunit SecA [Verrucomicrobiae bacterium]
MTLAIRSQYEKRGFAQAKLHRILSSLKGRGNQQASDEKRLEAIELRGKEIGGMTDSKIRETVTKMRGSVMAGRHELEDLTEIGFALVREAARRAVGMYHYPEQILAGLGLVRGSVAEMATGEGKTLAISLPAFVFALEGRGVHVATVNSYLAERDFEFSEPIFKFLGMTIGYLPEKNDTEGKKVAYRKDITYGTGYEFGFDYLRDQLILMRHPHPGPRERLRQAIMEREALALPPIVQRPLAFAIVDEIDSVLIDEAGSPLLISESAETDDRDKLALLLAKKIANGLEEGTHYRMEGDSRKIELTQGGFDSIHEPSEIPWESLRRPWQSYVLNALKAELLFNRDVHYVIDEEGKVVIIDEFTGRRHSERTWREGLHQAIEAKEGVDIRPEHHDAASVTRQRYFSRYEKMAGLTGTASESAGEFWHFFKLGVEPVPLHKPSKRTVLPERVFQSEAALDDAVVADVRERHARRQPILIGTRTIKVSERLAARFEAEGIRHRVLNAKQDKEENEMVSNAGQPGNVLIATNMAGRGTHISLTPQSEAAGGLHVIVVERNESARIDRQLIGRAARQGQPGSAQVFVSADDHLIERYAPEVGESIRKASADANGEVSTEFSKVIDQLQHRVERIRYDQRLRIAERDKWLHQTRQSLA